MCDCVSWYYVIVLICIVVFFQILMYKIGHMQGEQSAFKRFDRICNECRNATVRKSRTVKEKGE